MWRLVRRDGLEQASVRNVAREAGLSTGSLRHYFASQSELLSFAMALVADRVRRRVLDVEASGNPREHAEQILHELLPLDEERRAEAEVWLAFTARALVDPELRRVREETYDALHQVCQYVVHLLLGPASGSPGSELEIERLYAVLDGLTLHALLRPEATTSDRAIATLAAHLDQLAHAGRQRQAGAYRE